MDKLSYHRHRFPSIIIQQAVWLYFRFGLSYRDVEDSRRQSPACTWDMSSSVRRLISVVFIENSAVCLGFNFISSVFATIVPFGPTI